MLTKNSTIGILLICIVCMFLWYVVLTSAGYSEHNLMEMLSMKATNYHSINKIPSKYKTIWANWIKDNKLSAILNSNGNFSEEEIQSLYEMSEHHTAGALSQNLSVIILGILGNLVQEKIERNQNPENCGKRKTLVVTMDPSGYGSEIKLIALALHDALYTGRTLILISKKKWRYSKAGWEKFHQPLSKNCTSIDPKASRGKFLDSTHSGKLVLRAGYQDLLKHSKVPAGIPRDIAPLLVTVHSRPTLWWHAQFLKYVSRLQNWVQARVDIKRKELVNRGLVAPYVGVHIRRGDKIGREALFHSVKEYMKATEENFKKLEVKNKMNREVKSDVHIDGMHSYNSTNQRTVNNTHKGITDVTQTNSSINNPVRSGKRVDEYKRQIYLATDDDTVLAKMKKLYPEYQIFVYTSNHHKRYGEDNLMEIIMDLTFLSEADFNVCTLSSNICRRVLDFKEIADHLDITSNIHSLDLPYYSNIIPEFIQAKEDHIGDNSTLSMVKGDVIRRLKWDFHKVRPLDIGYGYNERTEKSGVYPISKTKYYIKIADYPIFQNRNRSRAESIIQNLTKELI